MIKEIKNDEKNEKLTELKKLFFEIEQVDGKVLELESKSQLFLQAYPESFQGLRIYAFSLALQEKFDEAIKIYQKALQIEHESVYDSSIQLNLITAYISTKQYKKASEYLKSIKSQIPKLFEKGKMQFRNMLQKITQETGEIIINEKNIPNNIDDLNVNTFFGVFGNEEEIKRLKRRNFSI